MSHTRIVLPLAGLLCCLLLPAQLAAEVRTLDPARGETLAGALSKLRPGDVAVLKSGYHGEISIDGRRCDPPITVTAAPGESPALGRLMVKSSSGWTFRGLTISPSLVPGGGKRGTIVNLGQRHGKPSSKLVIEDCFIYDELDASGWDAQRWAKACSGITLDHQGTGLIARNNHVLNIRFGINLSGPGCIAEGNVVENFSGDGMRVVYHDQTAQFNLIKNCYNVDDNHDDGIQTFLHHKGTGTVKNAKILHNFILQRERESQPFHGSLQGIGFFDGPLINYRVEGNVVAVSAYHGIALYDAQGCTITGNTVFDPWKGQAWIRIDGKKKQQKDNTVTGNRCPTYKIKSPGLTEADNVGCSKAELEAAQKQLLAEINRRYGPRHPISGLPRMGADGMGVEPQGYAPYRGEDDDAGSGDEPRRERSAKADTMAMVATEEALSRFNLALHARVLDAASGRRPPRFHAKALGGAEVELRGLHGETLTLYHLGTGADMQLGVWSQLTPEERAELALGSLRPGEEADRALAAFWCRVAGDRSEAQAQLAQCTGAFRDEHDAAFVPAAE